jgi:formylglycine-generating enzyme required for sulfatase activity
VEKVSWDDCRGFLARLGELAPGLVPALPSEAQWEYACRAGTRTPFSFGERLDPELANYDGNYPYNGQPKGLYRQKTLPVAHFEPNPWGLYQMHGNVWEWCADWSSGYPDGPAEDPAGPEQGRERVLRGGSWARSGVETAAARPWGDRPIRRRTRS